MPGRRFEVVSFLSDFGHDDVFVGVCHGVIAARAPHVRVIDLVHTVPPHDVRTGAVLLARAVPYLPVAVHLAVVDPGVGTARRGVVVRAARGDVLVAPDNGLVEPAVDALGGATGAWELAQPAGADGAGPSATFHGRDVFAPAAGAVAAGAEPAGFGPAVIARQRLELPTSQHDEGRFATEVLLVDRFGNLQLAATREDLEALGVGHGGEVEVRCAAGSFRVPVVRTFGELPAGQVGLYEDSDRQLALTVNRGSASRMLDLGLRDMVTVRAVSPG